MKDIERVRVLTTLKAGEELFLKGKIYEKPIPHALIEEMRANTGLVEVLGRVETAPPVQVETPPPPVHPHQDAIDQALEGYGENTVVDYADTTPVVPVVEPEPEKVEPMKVKVKSKLVRRKKGK